MIRGSIAAIVTPMNAAGEVGAQRLARSIDLHLHAGIHGCWSPTPQANDLPMPAVSWGVMP